MKTALVRSIGIAILLSVGLAGGAALADPVALKGDQITAKLKGNTLSGTEDGKSWTEYFLPDGAVRGIWGGDRYSGKWSIKGDQLCEEYPGDPSSNFCDTVSMDGDTLHYQKPDGSDDGEAKFASGNPKNL
jgi:hypothetical protein